MASDLIHCFATSVDLAWTPGSVFSIRVFNWRAVGVPEIRAARLLRASNSDTEETRGSRILAICLASSRKPRVSIVS